MASKFRRNGIWYIKYKDVDGKWKNYSCGPDASSGDAEAVRTQYANKEFNARHKVPIKKIEVDFKQTMMVFRDEILIRSDIGRDKAKNTLRRERVVVDNFLLWAEGKGVLAYNKVTSEVIKKYFDHLQEENKAAKTRREERRIINKFFKWSIENNYCQVNPVDIPNPKRELKRPRFFTEEELKFIFANSNQPYTNIFKFLYLTGIRVGELSNLEWPDYIESNSMILIRVMDGNKTKRAETVPLSRDAIKIIKEQLELKKSATTEEQARYIFTNRAGLKLDINNVYRALQRIMDDEKNPILGATTHTFRHTCASHLVIKGVSLYVVKDILRHASIKETEIYAHLSKDVVRTAIEQLTA